MGAEQKPSIDLYRGVIALLLIAVLFGALNWLEGRFAKSDQRKAIEVVKAYRAIPEGPTIEDALLRRHEGQRSHDIAWSSAVVSSCHGHVRVSAYLPKSRDDASATYRFDVNLNGPSIHPTDPKTVIILQTLTATSGRVRARASQR